MTSRFHSPTARPALIDTNRSATAPLVVAHRGSSQVRPEHTLGAYLAAIDEGADALECDVRLTADGHLVCIHDRKVNRTSNGKGSVSTLELPYLTGLDFAAREQERRRMRRPLLNQPNPVGHVLRTPEQLDDSGVLTLERLLEVLADAARPVQLLVEVKHPTRYAALVEHRLVELLDRFGLTTTRAGQTQVTVMSFAVLALRRVRTLAPNLPTVLLMQRFLAGRADGGLPSSADIAGPGFDLLATDPTYVRRAHARGRQVFVWTVDEPDRVAQCVEWGVDAIITNRPGTARAIVDRTVRTS
jgi:glycerophosphoryl diester phosphodiesterase